jgi:myo-inositol-1(or 4)-monophosphatase
VSAAELLGAATEAARLAGAELKRRFDLERTVHEKGGRRIDLVTDADTASEAVLVEFLTRRFPDHGLLAEESGQVATGGHTWLVDPLDGTTNYAHHVPHWCVTLAVEGPVDGETVLLAGVVFDPLRDELFAAARGQGATLNGQRLATSTAATLDRALLSTGFPYDVHQRPEAPVGLFNRFIRRAQGIRRFGSAALDLAFVACGRYDGYFEFGLKPWDIAAGALLVQEAGGVVTRIDGAPLDVRVGDLLAAGPVLHGPLAAECQAFVKEIGWAPRRFGA